MTFLKTFVSRAAAKAPFHEITQKIIYLLGLPSAAE